MERNNLEDDLSSHFKKYSSLQSTKSRLKINEIHGLQNCKQNICWFLIKVQLIQF